MIPIKITGKRTWKEDDYTFYEVYCNGLKIVERHQKPLNDPARAWKSIQNTCKGIKVSGETDTEKLREWFLPPKYKQVMECELPEWEDHQKYYWTKTGYELHNPSESTKRAFHAGDTGHFHAFTSSGTATFVGMDEVTTEKPEKKKIFAKKDRKR